MNILESDVPFSRSLLWDLQREYFQTAGVTAWSTHTVPLYVTNNPALARAYAAVVAAWLEDARATEAPLTIVELGAGSGRFTFLLLRQLELLFGQQPPVPFRYVATDFARQNVDFCREHPQLQSFRERGWLDFAVFDTERDSSLTLLDRGAVIQTGDLHAPLLVIANYVFDGLRNDAFRMQDGTLSELRYPGIRPDRAAGCGSRARRNLRLSRLAWKPRPVFARVAGIAPPPRRTIRGRAVFVSQRDSGLSGPATRPHHRPLDAAGVRPVSGG